MRKPIRAPFGRMPEKVAALTDDEKRRAAIKHAIRLGEDDTLQVFPNRESLAKLIRKEERNSPRSQWSPVVKLGDGEGY